MRPQRIAISLMLMPSRSILARVSSRSRRFRMIGLSRTRANSWRMTVVDAASHVPCAAIARAVRTHGGS